jgi:hypothetical protein
MAIVDKKMRGRFDSPLHLAAYLLNPHYSYVDTSLFDDGTIIEGFISCVETFCHDDEDMEDQVVNKELRVFQNKVSAFAKKLARSYQNFDYNPDNFVFSFKFSVMFLLLILFCFYFGFSVLNFQFCFCY